VPGLNPAHDLRCAGEIGPHAAAWWPAAHEQSRPNPAVLTARGASEKRWARSLRGARARGGTVARRPRAHRQFACHEGEGTRAVGGVRQARWEMAWLIEEVRCRWGGGERPARRRSDDGGRSDGDWRCSVLPCGSTSGRKR
jgi:hypothetical protein